MIKGLLVLTAVLVLWFLAIAGAMHGWNFILVGLLVIAAVVVTVFGFLKLVTMME